MDNPIKISIVVPVFNSESSIDLLVDRITDSLREIEYELILVNDKSKDKSWDKIVAYSASNDRIKGVSLKKNFGQDNAIMAGLIHSTGEFVVIMDDDLQHSPEDILKLYGYCKSGEGFDVCYGFFKTKNQSLWKNWGSKLNGYLAKVLLKKPKGLYISPFKIIHASIVREIIHYKGPFPYVDGIIFSLTSNITQIEIMHHRRYAGKSNFSMTKSLSVFVRHLTGYSLYPLRIATFIGLWAATLSFLLGGYFLFDYLTNDHHVEGWITLVLLIIFFNGLMLMCIGIIGEYIGRVYLTSTTKPQYVVDKLTWKKK
ncbi:MAG: glycosyltransferase family 2 protein [Cyclobacteriaceae bacterium]